mmetsp:Transcript_67842/g.196259  ORF Transcript_67842/g.196259 Transcript_67842/m.196259 type:complete len:355 (+) Transcript_67842:562-1626(+)
MELLMAASWVASPICWASARAACAEFSASGATGDMVANLWSIRTSPRRSPRSRSSSTYRFTKATAESMPRHAVCARTTAHIVSATPLDEAPAASRSTNASTDSASCSASCLLSAASCASTRASSALAVCGPLRISRAIAKASRAPLTAACTSPRTRSIWADKISAAASCARSPTSRKMLTARLAASRASSPPDTCRAVATDNQAAPSTALSPALWAADKLALAAAMAFGPLLRMSCALTTICSATDSCFHSPSLAKALAASEAAFSALSDSTRKRCTSAIASCTKASATFPSAADFRTWAACSFTASCALSGVSSSSSICTPTTSRKASAAPAWSLAARKVSKASFANDSASSA